MYATLRKVDDWRYDAIPNLAVLPLDVTSDSSVKSAVDTIIKAEGRIDVVINNAGQGMAGTVEMVNIKDAKVRLEHGNFRLPNAALIDLLLCSPCIYQDLFDVNVWGPVRLLQAVLPIMRKNRKGYVINLSSTSGIRGLPAFDIYTGSCKTLCLHKFIKYLCFQEANLLWKELPTA